MRLTLTRAARATRTSDGPATIDLRIVGEELRAEAWGAGADRLLASLPALVGLDDDRIGFEPQLHPVVERLARLFPGLRLSRTGSILEALVPAVLEQKVTGTEAFRAFRRLVLVHGEPAPGPLALHLAPTAETLAGLPYHAYHPLGVERRRAELIRRVAADAHRLEALVDGSPATAAEQLRRYPGIGPWTAAEVTLRAFGDPDAVSVGDFHLPSLVGWILAGERRADDARMLELLEPWRGHRARVIRLLEVSGLGPARRGPRLAPRSIAGM